MIGGVVGGVVGGVTGDVTLGTDGTGFVVCGAVVYDSPVTDEDGISDEAISDGCTASSLFGSVTVGFSVTVTDSGNDGTSFFSPSSIAIIKPSPEVPLPKAEYIPIESKPKNKIIMPK